MNLANAFVSDAYDRAFLKVYASAFSCLLKEAATNAGDWQRFLETLRKHGLLTVHVTRMVTLPPFEIAGKDGEKIVFDYGKPVEFGFDRLDINIELSKLDEPGYLSENSAILAYLLACKILPGKGDALRIVLLRMDSKTLKTCLRKLHRGQSDADGIARFILASALETAVDELVSRSFKAAS